MRTEEPDGRSQGGTGTALIPLTPASERAHKGVLPHPDPSFVTQLIANAEQVPQASRLRRASPADAKTAYGERRPVPTLGVRTRQVA